MAIRQRITDLIDPAPGDGEETLDPFVARLSMGETEETLRIALCDALDRVVRSASESHLPANVADRLLFLAVGGYGRRDVYPHGDLDLVILYPCDDADDPPGADDAADRLARIDPELPDALKAMLLTLQGAVRLGVRVRTVREHLSLVATDVTVATSALDARVLFGDLSLLPQPEQTARLTIATRFPGGTDAFCRLIHDGVTQRHAQHGGSAFMLEPQLKTGRGGLRDAHAVHWTATLRWGASDLDLLIAGGHITRAEADDFRSARAFIRRTRLALHALSRWRNDRLVFERQVDVARLMGFGHGADADAVSGFMQAFYRHAEALANLTERWLQEWNSQDTTREAIGNGVEKRGDKISHSEDNPARDLSTVARLVGASARTGLHLHATARSLLREIAAGLDARCGTDEAAVATLRAALFSLGGDAYPVRALIDLGLLQLLMPEWAHLVGHTSHDVYHVYTTDRHLFECFRLLARALETPDDLPAFLRDIVARLRALGPDWEQPLRLAALVHDIGKGLAGDHSLIGAGMSHEIARRLRLDPTACERTRWLVLEHLRMPRTSQRRDLSDATTIDLFLREIPDLDHLDALTLLTWADMSSVAPGMQIGWKIDLLAMLHKAARLGLAGPLAGPPPLDAREPVRELVRQGILTDDDVAWLTAELNDREWGAIDDPELRPILTDLLLLRHGDITDRASLEVFAGPGRARLRVTATDKPGLLHRLTGAIAAERINILNARIFTSRSGAAIDRFDLQWADPGGRPFGPRKEKRLVETVEAVLSGAIGTDELRRRFAGESTLTPRQRPEVREEISVLDDLARPDRWIVEVKTRDRIGLLADVSLALSELGYTIDRSIVSAEGDRAIDTFYVRATSNQAVDRARLPSILSARLQELQNGLDRDR